jgi:hypothetical protein
MFLASCTGSSQNFAEDYHGQHGYVLAHWVHDYKNRNDTGQGVIL